MESQERKNLIFIENKNQIILFEKYFGKPNFNSDYEVIALKPSVQVELLKLNIKFTKSDFYFKNNDHIEVIKKTDEIVSELRRDFYLEDLYGVSHAYERTFFYYLRQHLNYCITLIIIINNSMKLGLPYKIILPASSNLNYIGEKSLIGSIGKLIDNKKKFEIIILGKNKTKLRQPTLSYFSRIFYQFLFNIQLLLYKFYSKDKNIIFTANSAYNITRVVDDISQIAKNTFNVGASKLKGKQLLMSVIIGKVGHFFFFPPQASQRKLNIFTDKYYEVINNIDKKIKSDSPIFSMCGIPLKNLIIYFLKNKLKYEMQKTFYGSVAFNKILNIRKPALVLSNQATGYHYAIGEQCKIRKVDGILISHGTHVTHFEKWPKKEWDEQALTMINTHFPHVAIQTPLAEKFLEQQKIISKPVSTGPLLYAREQRKKKEEVFFENHKKTIILHAATPFSWQNLSPYVNLTQDEYIHHINDLISSIEKMDNVFLAIRIRLKTFQDMSLDDIKKLLKKSDCYEVFTEGSFENYLLCSDLLVSFSSTTIEEALQVKIPVLQYDPFNRYEHIPSCNLSYKNNLNISPIYYVSNYKNLITSLEWIKSNHLDIPNSKNLVDWSPYKIKDSDIFKSYIEKLII